MSNKLSFGDVFRKGSVIFNPVLVQLAGLCPVVAASTSLKNAVMLSVVAFAELVAVCFLASALMKKIPRWVRMPLYLIIGLALICPVLWFIETKTLINLSLSMKIYIPLIAINSVVAVHCEQFAVKNTVKLALYDAAAVGLGASLVFIFVGAVREILGSSTIGGVALNLPVSLKGMLLPFGCLVILGFMAAALKSFVSKRYSEEMAEPEVQPEAEPELPEEVQPEPEEIEEVGIDVPDILKEAEVQIEKTEQEKMLTVEEIDELLRTLGIDTEETGDKQQ